MCSGQPRSSTLRLATIYRYLISHPTSGSLFPQWNCTTNSLSQFMLSYSTLHYASSEAALPVSCRQCPHRSPRKCYANIIFSPCARIVWDETGGFRSLYRIVQSKQVVWTSVHHWCVLHTGIYDDWNRTAESERDYCHYNRRSWSACVYLPAHICTWYLKGVLLSNTPLFHTCMCNRGGGSFLFYSDV